jgi:hypothetical protein
MKNRERTDIHIGLSEMSVVDAAIEYIQEIFQDKRRIRSVCYDQSRDPKEVKAL